MKYMILLYGSQRDYDALTGKAVPGKPAWAPADFAAMGAFMAEFSKDLAESGELVETRGPFRHPGHLPVQVITLIMRGNPRIHHHATSDTTRRGHLHQDRARCGLPRRDRQLPVPPPAPRRLIVHALARRPLPKLHGTHQNTCLLTDDDATPSSC